MEKELAGVEAAQRLGIHPNTLSQWESQLGIKVEVGSKRRKRYTPEVLAILQQVKDLRDQDAGFNTIRRQLNITPTGDTQDETQGESESSVAHNVVAQELLEMIRAKDAEIARLHEHYQAELAKTNERLTTTATVAAQFQERAQNLGEQVKLLTSGTHGDHNKRPWWKVWS